MRRRRSTVGAPISRPWLFAGAALLAASVAAPFGLLNISERALAPVAAAGAKIDGQKSAETSKQARMQGWTAFGGASVHPGRGIGQIAIGDRIGLHLDDLPKRTIAYFVTSASDEARVFDVPVGQATLKIFTEGADGDIKRMRLSNASCEELP
ncbi:MAG: hypothetical protein AAGJ28_22275, partial [Pseudomonadota bacterium]